jgi:hypothetical protein
VHTYREEVSDEVIRIIISPSCDTARKETICPSYRLRSERNFRNSLPALIVKST